MNKSSTANYWLNFMDYGDVGLKKQTHTRKIVIQACQPTYTSPLHNLQHGMTSLCIFGPELHAYGWCWSLWQPLMAGTSCSSLFFSVGFLASGCVTFACSANVSGLTEITHKFPPSCAITRLTRCQKGWIFFFSVPTPKPLLKSLVEQLHSDTCLE